MSAKISTRARTKKKVVTPVNAVARRGRGRPRKDRQADSDAGVLLRGEDYRRVLSARWDRLESILARVRDAADADKGVKLVREAWQGTELSDGSDEFPFLSLSRLAPRVVEVVRDKKCPKQRDDQITFVADALSGLHLAPPTDPERCQRERNKRGSAEKRRGRNQTGHGDPLFA